MKHTVRSLSVALLAIVLLLTLLPGGVWATETTEATQAAESDPFATSGTCGDNLTWSLENGTLTISGSGEMSDGAPWSEHKFSVRSIVFTGGVTSVAESAFEGFSQLTSIDFGSSMKEIGYRAFADCDDLTSIHLPATFRLFGPESFHDCDNLTVVDCDGGMPSFREGCLWNNNHIVVYCPTNNPWPQQYVQELVENFGGRLQVVVSDSPSGSEETTPTTEATQPATTAPTTQPTEPPTQPTTAPTTQPTTAPTTQPTTVPTTQPPTEPSQTAPAPTVAPTEPAEVQRISNSMIWVLLGVGAVSLLAAVVLILRAIWHKDGQYDD